MKPKPKPKTPKKSKLDVNEMAHQIVQRATEERESERDEEKAPKPKEGS